MTASEFNREALALFAHQYTHNLPYHHFCNGRGKTPENVIAWQEIPAAPASAFKHFPLTCAPESECVKVWHSSGTTSTETSRHFMDAPALDAYKKSLHAGFVASIGTQPVLALMPTPEDAPHSSLSFMASELIATHSGEFFWGNKWQERLTASLQSINQPMTLFGTAFAWVHFFDALNNAKIPLPSNTKIIETGGFKGKSREVSRDELYGWFVEKLGVPLTHCHSEYGMSEMASQFYSTGNGPLYGPDWLQTRVLDPLTETECPNGTPGLLAHYDLANTNSVLAIQTEDWGYKNANGDGSLVLLGRAPGAVLRGCSLLAE
jgi:Acyl-protein synthetase, LuxE